MNGSIYWLDGDFDLGVRGVLYYIYGYKFFKQWSRQVSVTCDVHCKHRTEKEAVFLVIMLKD